MARPLPRSNQALSRNAILLSVGVIALPVAGAIFFPEELGEYGALLWLVGLVPIFYLAYHRALRGVILALGAGIVALAITQIVVLVLGLPVPGILSGIVVAYLMIAAGIGLVTRRLHADREEVVDLAFTDTLTGLPNRRHARAFLENEFAAAQRGRRLTIVLFDLDRFKQYNDRYGHQAGDDVLKAFAEVLARTTRRMNLSARYGGEEFLAILAGSDSDGAFTFADRVRATLAAHRLGEETLTTSAGVAEYTPEMKDPDALLAAADRALYEAKNAGRDRVRVFGRTEYPPSDSERPGSDEASTATEEARPEEPTLTRVTEDAQRDLITGFGNGRKVLLVQGDDQVRGIISDYLEQEEFDVSEATGVIAGVRALRVEHDIVVSDIRLSEATATELITAAKSRWPATQVVIVTGLQEARTSAQAFQAGADQYLFKPFGMPELKAHLVDAIRRREHLIFERRQQTPTTFEEKTRGSLVRQAVIDGARTLVRAVELRDPFTQGQMDRVADVAAAIARQIDPDGALLDPDSLRLACELRDLGKIGVPDAILNKQGPLTGDEIKKVQLHPQIGRQILDPLLSDEIVLAVVSWHHERWDGAGYPDRLAGESIPLAARVAGLADSLEAMMSNRAYREGLAWSDAIREVRRLAGRQFDPSLLKPFEQVLPELQEIYESGRLSRSGSGLG